MVVLKVPRNLFCSANVSFESWPASQTTGCHEILKLIPTFHRQVVYSSPPVKSEATLQMEQEKRDKKRKRKKQRIESAEGEEREPGAAGGGTQEDVDGVAMETTSTQVGPRGYADASVSFLIVMRLTGQNRLY